VRGWRPRRRWYAGLAGVVGALSLAGCGAGARQDASEPNGTFPIQVAQATFPTSQRLAEHTQLVIAVRNAGQRTIPNVAVTILAANAGTTAQAFGDLTSGTGEALASHSRPVWIVDQPPGPCHYSCQTGGLGAAVTAYSNTWALGALRPGATATFAWKVTAIKPGVHVVRYQVAAGLNGKARAVDSNGQRPGGTFVVHVHQAPRQAHVNDAGQIVYTR
jgi:hypothetical protein